MLKQKAIVLAVAGAMGVPVVAFAQNVQVYGKVYPQFATMKSSGASSAADLNPVISPGAVDGDLKRRNSVDANNSRIGFRGSEDLGGGLKAIFQIESKTSIDTGGNLWASRDSFVGLSGGFGTVKLGNMDTVYKSLGDPIGILGISSGNFVSDSSVLSQGPLSGIDFHQREKNSIIYESPSFGGVTLLAEYASPAKEEQKPAGSHLKASTQSYGVKYEVGPLYLAAATEIRKDQFMFSSSDNIAAGFFTPSAARGESVHSKDQAVRGAAMYEFPTHTKVSLDVAQIKLQETGGAPGTFAEAKNKRWAVTAEQGLGNVKVAASYAKSDKGNCSLNGGGGCFTDGFEGSQFNLGAMLNLSKRTGVFAIYSRLTNGSSAMFNNTPANDVSPGSDVTQAAVGVSHSF
jgi:predicted porin